jgi:WD40 repeat protein
MFLSSSTKRATHSGCASAIRRTSLPICVAVALSAAPWLPAPGAIAADGAWIAPAGAPLQADLAGGELNSIAFSADGKQAVIDTDEALVVVDAATFKPLKPPLKAHRDNSGLAVLLSGGQRLVVSTWGNLPGKDKSGNTVPQQAGKLQLVELAGRRVQDLATLGREPRLLAAQPDGRQFAVAYADNTVQVFDGAGKSLLGPARLVAGQVVAGTKLDAVTAIALSPDGKRLAVGGEDVTIRLFDIASGKPTVKLDNGAFQGVTWVHGPARQIVFTPDGTRIVSFEQGNNLALHDAATGKPLGGSVQVRNNVAALVPLADGSGLWIAQPDGTSQRWQWAK